jgi:glutamate/tyrosine decarboxylase-like PLP-dependent enzyme
MTDSSESLRDSSLDIAEQELNQLSRLTNELVLDYFNHVSEFPVFPETYAGKTTELLGTELSQAGTPFEQLIDDCRTIMSHSRHNGHPRFFGYVASPSTPIGAYADLIASTLNSNVTCWRSAPAATEIERIVVRWLGSLIGYDKQARGLLTSGGSMANMIALFVASRQKTGSNTSRRGLWNSTSPLSLYASEEVHMSIPKAADILGFGRDQVRMVPCDGSLRMNVAALQNLIQKDVQDGLKPFCVVASAGTVGTGAVDPLADIADVARKFDLWFHVDGAYGAPAALDEEKRRLFSGLDRADSVSLDPHKWLYAPVDAGSLLLRNEAAAMAAFGVADADYIQTHGLSDQAAFAFWDYGSELSRRFRALKIWLTLRYYGVLRIAAAIKEDMALAEYLASRIEADAEFELLAPVQLSICCFRYLPTDVRVRLASSDETERTVLERQVDSLNERVMSLVQKSGRAYLSNATVRGRFALRACITNFRTTRADIDQTLEVVRELAKTTKA